jgi:hypothetical protein
MTPLVKHIKPYKLKELADLYFVSKQTFIKWLAPFKDRIGERKGHFYTVEQVKIIFTCLGVPSSFDDID